MKCNCERAEDLRTVRTYEAGDTGSTAEMVCPCGRKFTCVKLLLHQIEKRGQGAFAVAQRLRKGQLTINPTDETPR